MKHSRRHYEGVFLLENILKSRNLRQSQSRCYFEVTVEEIIWDFTSPTVPIGRWEKLRQTMTAVSKAHHKTWFIHSHLNQANINHCSALRLHTSGVECGRDFVDIVPSKPLSIPPTTTLSYFSQSFREILLITSLLNVNLYFEWSFLIR